MLNSSSRIEKGKLALHLIYILLVESKQSPDQGLAIYFQMLPYNDLPKLLYLAAEVI